MSAYDKVRQRYQRSNYPTRFGSPKKRLFWREMYNEATDTLFQKIVKGAGVSAELILANHISAANLTNLIDKKWAVVLYYYIHAHEDWHGQPMAIPTIADTVGLKFKQLYVVMWALSIPTREKPHVRRCVNQNPRKRPDGGGWQVRRAMAEVEKSPLEKK